METIKTKIERISVVEDIFHILKIAGIKKWVIVKDGHCVVIRISKSFPLYLVKLMLKDIEQKLMIGLSIYIYNDLN